MTRVSDGNRNLKFMNMAVTFDVNVIKKTLTFVKTISPSEVGVICWFVTCDKVSLSDVHLVTIKPYKGQGNSNIMSKRALPDFVSFLEFCLYSISVINKDSELLRCAMSFYNRFKFYKRLCWSYFRSPGVGFPAALLLCPDFAVGCSSSVIGWHESNHSLSLLHSFGWCLRCMLYLNGRLNTKRAAPHRIFMIAETRNSRRNGCLSII